jgi:ubiquinone/menaquinone biosynthesis C-methylase UbiE
MEKTCLSVAEAYERWAPVYDHDPNPILNLEERQLKRLMAPIDGKRALDLACGTGRWLEWILAEGAGLAVGMDFSPAMLGIAKQKAALQRHLARADCQSIPFASSTFELVICSFAAGHISDLYRMAKEVSRVAAANADVYVSDLHPHAYRSGWQTGFRDGGGAVRIATFPRSTQEFIAPWFAAGFECAQTVECRFGELDRLTLAQAGKGREFRDLCRIPAVLICHFQRPGRQ